MPTPEEIQASVNLFTNDVGRFNEMLLGSDETDVEMSDTSTRGSIAKQVKERVDQVSGTGIYANTTAGLAATTNGKYFSIPAPGIDGYLDLYLNSSGVAVYQKTYPSLTAVQNILAMMRENANVDGLAWADAGGFVFAALTLLGKLTTNAFTADGTGFVGQDSFKVTKDGLYLDANTFIAYNNNAGGLVFTDAGGFIYLSISSTGEYNYIGKPDPNSWTDQEIQTANAEAAAYSESVRNQSNPLTPYPSTDWVVFVMYGQSLAVGTEGWPALSKTAKYGNKMYGACERPTTTAGTTFAPVGSDALYDLVSTCQDVNTAAVLNDATVAALDTGDGASGESALAGWVNGAKRFYNLSGGDSGRVFIGVNCAVGGKSIAELSKGASPHLYNRYLSAITGIKALANAAGKTVSVHSVAYFQGERDYVLNTGKSDYKAALIQLQSDFIADAKSITGQFDSPLFMTYQTGGSYTNDTQDIAIGNAQLDASNEQTNYALASPTYQVTDKGDHLDPNGYRWMGCQLAKVWEKLVLRRQGWKPVQPLTAELKGREILVTFHVPCAPLQFGLPWVGLQAYEGEGLTATDYINKGFRVLDVDNHLQTISSVHIVADRVVKITLATAPTVDIKVLYGTKTSTDGNGNLMDSDASIANDNYEYHAGTGQYSAANIPELVDKPYPLNNWCVAFTKTIGV